MLEEVFSWSPRRSEGIASAKLIPVDRGAGTICASLQVGDTDRACVVGEMADGRGSSTALGSRREKFRMYIL